MIENQLTAAERKAIRELTQAVTTLTAAVDRLDRTIQGDAAEGNEGILPRLFTLEKRVERLYWAFPFLVTAGTAIGQVIAKWLGL